MCEDLAADIRDYLATRKPTTPSRKSKPTHSLGKLFDVAQGLVKIMNRDIAVAGITKQDARGCYVDVHALRHTFATQLSRNGVSLRTAQAAMRHSDPRLTANIYTHPELEDVADAVNRLPALPLRAEKNPQPQAKRITAEPTTLSLISEGFETRKLVPRLVLDSGNTGHFESIADNELRTEGLQPLGLTTLQKAQFSKGLSRSVISRQGKNMARLAGFEPTTLSFEG